MFCLNILIKKSKHKNNQKISKNQENKPKIKVPNYIVCPIIIEKIASKLLHNLSNSERILKNI
jgi:hypothetical protein